MLAAMKRFPRWGWIIGAAVAAAILFLPVLSTLRFEWAYRRAAPWLAPCAERYGLPPRLVAAVAWQESRFRAGKRGAAGERGLMQVTEPAGREWARAEGLPGFAGDDLLDPRTNLCAGAWYLARAVRRWQDRPDALAVALAEYNAGPSNARRWASAETGEPGTNVLRTITYPATRAYVRDVLRRARCGAAAPIHDP